jgi:hypothetical protein
VVCLEDREGLAEEFSGWIAYFVDQDLPPRLSVQLVYVRHDYGDNQVDHDDGTKDDEANEESHGEDEGEGVGRVGVFVKVIKLKLSEHHYDDLQYGLARMVEIFVVAAETYYEKGKSKGYYDNYEGCSSLKTFCYEPIA